MQWQNLLWVGIGGFFGANSRYLLSSVINQYMPSLIGRPLPIATAFVNITGSFFLALFISYASKRVGFPDSAKLLIGTGFFGAFTTFSTYANESIALINEGQWVTGFSYIIASNILCLFGVVCGLVIAHRLF